MQRQYVQSTDICSVGYDFATATLEIEFHSGGIYQYFNVPEAVFKRLIMFPHPGTYFHRSVKPFYRYTQVN